MNAKGACDKGRGRPDLKRLLIPILLVLAGAAFCIYGAGFHSRSVLSNSADNEAPTPVLKSEPSLIQEISVGGVVRLASGEIELTYDGEAGQPDLP